jgi:hypothetical protein
MSLHLFLVLSFFVTGVQTQGLAGGRKALNHWTISQSLLLFYIWDRVTVTLPGLNQNNILLSLPPEYLGIWTGMCHHLQLRNQFYFYIYSVLYSLYSYKNWIFLIIKILLKYPYFTLFIDFEGPITIEEITQNHSKWFLFLRRSLAIDPGWL